jgi:hypothetical protein
MSLSSSIQLLLSSQKAALLTLSSSERTAATEACKELKLSLVQKTVQMVLCELSRSFFDLLVDFL